MKDILVSVIVTVHNAEEFIDECIMSIRNQTYKNIEIICLDGGSKDSTPERLQAHAEADDRIVIVNDPNCSYGHKVNTGIAMAKGDYITIVESDDRISENLVEHLLHIAVEADVDVVSADYLFTFDYQGKNIGYHFRRMPDEMYGRVIDYKNGERHYTHGGITGLLMNSDFIRKNRIMCNETPGASFQDQGITFLLDTYTSKRVNAFEPLYLYRTDNPGSSVVDSKKILEITWEFDYIESELKNRGITDYSIWNEYYNYKYGECVSRMKSYSMNSKTIFEKKLLEIIEDDKKRQTFEKFQIEKRFLSEINAFEEDNAYFEQFIQTKKIPTNDRLAKVLDETINSKAVIVGANRAGENLSSMLNILNRFDCLADNSIYLQGKKVLVSNSIILSIEDAVKKFSDAIFIVMSDRYFEEIEEQLLSCGICKNQIKSY